MKASRKCDILKRPLLLGSEAEPRSYGIVLPFQVSEEQKKCVDHKHPPNNNTWTFQTSKTRGNGEKLRCTMPTESGPLAAKKVHASLGRSGLDGWRDLVEIIEPRFMKIWPYQCWTDQFLIFRPLQSNMNCGGENRLRLWQFFRKCCPLFQIWFKKVRVYLAYFILSSV